MKKENQWRGNLRKRYIIKIAYIVFCILIFYNVLFLATTLNSDRKYIQLFNVSFAVIQDNSMKPTLNKNDFVIINKGKDYRFEQEDIIAYNYNNSIRVERIKNITNDNKYIVKGDNNYYYNTKEMNEYEFEGKVLVNIPFVGGILQLFQSKVATAFIIAILLFKYKFNSFARTKKLERLKRVRNNKV